ncbi:MAG: hypothetical protein ABI837_02965 [Acidobacteriota bacterium]
MTDKKNWGSTVKGWFVVQDPAPDASSDSNDYTPFGDVSAKGTQSPAANAAASAPPAEVFKSAPPQSPGGNVDFDKVFEAAGVDAEQRERITRTHQLLDSLPPGTDETVKRQIVMASLKAFGVPIEKIIETGAEELQALDAYIRNGAGDTEKVAAEAEQRVKQYEEEIVRLRTVMQERVTEQNQVIQNCNAKKLEVQKVLEFFGQDAVARVVRESPKLQEPAPSS